MWEYFEWERVKAELATWSPAHFAFDGFVSVLIGYLLKIVLGLAWYQLVILSLLIFGTVASLMLLLRQLPERIATTGVSIQDFQDQLVASEMVRKQNAANGVMRQIGVFMDSAPKDREAEDFDPRYLEWRQNVRAYLVGTCNDEVDRQFQAIAGSANNSVEALSYLAGLSNNFSVDHLRKPDHKMPTIG